MHKYISFELRIFVVKYQMFVERSSSASPDSDVPKKNSAWVRAHVLGLPYKESSLQILNIIIGKGKATPLQA
jgi:hypothetical protein